MSRWFRVYDDLVDDPKVQRLPGETVKSLLNLWCLASQNDGMLPAADDIAFKLRMTPSKVAKLLSVLGECGLIDSDEESLENHALIISSRNLALRRRDTLKLVRL